VNWKRVEKWERNSRVGGELGVFLMNLSCTVDWAPAKEEKGDFFVFHKKQEA